MSDVEAVNLPGRHDDPQQKIIDGEQSEASAVKATLSRILAATFEVQDYIKDLNLRFLDLAAQVAQLRGELEEVRQVIASADSRALADAARIARPRGFWRRLFPQ